MTVTRAFFTLDGVPSETPAWKMINILDLDKPAEKRGDEPTIIPGAHGALPNRMWRAATDRIIDGQVYGAADRNGNRNTDLFSGLRTNLDYLTTNWADLPGTTNETRTCVLHLPDGTTKTGVVQVVDFDWDWEQQPVMVNVTMRLRVLAGELT